MDKKVYNIKVDAIEIIEKSLYKGHIERDEIFKFEIKAQSIAHHEQNLVVAIISVVIKKTKTDTADVAKIMGAFGYFVEDLISVLVKKEDNIYQIPIDLEQLLKTVSISTMRGIMFSEFRGTGLHKAILPIIFANTLVPIEGSLIE